ncbi:MAG: cytochrome c biogenesis protein ResB [Thiolinea sp.]
MPTLFSCQSVTAIWCSSAARLEVEVKDFRVEHYSTGQPKSFESDLIIRDKVWHNRWKPPLLSTIRCSTRVWRFIRPTLATAARKSR